MENSEMSGFGYCDLHEEIIAEENYRYKGCWGCQHFEFGQAFPYVFVTEAAEKLQVSESTVRRLIKKCKLKGELFEQQITLQISYFRRKFKRILGGHSRRTLISLF